MGVVNFLSDPKLFIIPVPQHPMAGVPCCLGCGKRDGRTSVGAIHCHDCKDEKDNPTA